MLWQPPLCVRGGGGGGERGGEGAFHGIGT